MVTFPCVPYEFLKWKPEGGLFVVFIRFLWHSCFPFFTLSHYFDVKKTLKKKKQVFPPFNLYNYMLLQTSLNRINTQACGKSLHVLVRTCRDKALYITWESPHRLGCKYIGIFCWFIQTKCTYCHFYLQIYSMCT